MTPHRLAALLVLLAATAACLILSGGQSRAQSPATEWNVAERDQVTIWHTQGQERADILAVNGQGAHDLVSNLIDVSLDDPLTIIVWPSGADPTDPEQFPEGISEGVEPIHVMRGVSGEIRSAVTNALINTATRQHAGEVPFWFRAALGFWSAGPLPGFYLRRAGSVVIFDHEEYYSIEQLEVVPTTWQFQAKYFGQAGGMLAWMIQDWGPESLAQLLRLVGDGVRFYDAFEEVYGIPQENLIAEFTKNAERALLLDWPYIEPQSPPFYERLNINYIIIVASAIPGAILLFFVGKRMFYD